MKERTKRIITETGRFFQQNLCALLKNKDNIFASTELSNIHIPKLFVRNRLVYHELTLPLTVGGLLRLWEKGLMQTKCPCCVDGKLYAYHLDIDETARLFGVCASCGELVEFELTDDDRFVISRLAPDPNFDEARELYKARVAVSPLTASDLTRVLNGESVSHSETVVVNELDISDTERDEAKNAFFRKAADRSLGVFAHMALAKDKAKYEETIRVRMAELAGRYEIGKGRRDA